MALTIRSADLSGNRLLRRLIDDPDLSTTVQSLSPEALTRLIEHVGLEDLGEIVAYATAEQLLDVFDTDLWIRAAGGTDEVFNPERFLLWLEILLEGGDRTVAKRLADLPEDFVIAAFFEHILVLNLDDLAEAEQAWETDDINLADKALGDCLGYELDEFYIIARREKGWDTLVTVLVALYDHEPALLTRILERCCFASAEFIDDNGGLYDVLSAGEMLVSDAAGDRADRRAKKGFIAPSDAAAFLKTVARVSPAELLRAPEDDAITRAYFRSLDRMDGRPTRATAEREGMQKGAVSATAEKGGNRTAIQQLLVRAGIVESASPVHLLGTPGNNEMQTRGVGYHRWLSASAATRPEIYENKVRYLIYLANVLEAAFGRTEAPIRPADALKGVFDIIDVGLAYFGDVQKEKGAIDSSVLRLEDISPNVLFGVGYQILNKKIPLDRWSALKRALDLVRQADK